MMLTRGSLTSVVAEIRAVDAHVSALVAELQNSGVWSGADAERFLSRWDDDVHGRLRAAAHILDSVALTTVL